MTYDFVYEENTLRIIVDAVDIQPPTIINKEGNNTLSLMTANELMKLLGLKSRETFRQNYLVPALEAGIICMTIPEKPTSRNQMYYKK